VKLALLELPARFDAFDRSFADARALALRSPADLVLLPECALTGYVDPSGACELARFAEDASGTTSAALAALAKEARAVVVGPWIEREGARVFNSVVGFDREGRRVVHYRKRHPWFPEVWAHEGDLPYPTLEVGGVRMTLAICFDVHFVEREAAALLSSSEVLLFPSAWVDDGPIDLRGEIFRRIAEAHDVSVANANWGPGVPRVRGQGRSRFVSPNGDVVELATSDTLPSDARAERLDVQIEPRAE
jgi:predicted amidohydrolase